MQVLLQLQRQLSDAQADARSRQGQLDGLTTQLQAATAKLQLLDQVKAQLVEVSWLMQSRPCWFCLHRVHSVLVHLPAGRLGSPLRGLNQAPPDQSAAGGGELAAAVLVAGFASSGPTKQLLR